MQGHAVDDPEIDRCVRKPDDSEPFSALVFKIMTDPFVGQLAFIRVYSGKLGAGDSIYNVAKGRKERIGRLVKMHANKREEIQEILAGDICAAVGLKNVVYRRHDLRRKAPGAARIDRFPGAGDSARHRAEDQGRSGKAGHGDRTSWCRKIRRCKVSTDPDTGQTILAGMGELHLEIIVDRMQREFNVGANVGKPQVAYRETIRATGRVRLHAQEADRRQRPVCARQAARRAESGEANSNSKTKSAAATFPRNSFRPIEKGVVEALEGGILAGYPMVGLKVTRVRRRLSRSRFVGNGVQDLRFDLLKEAARKAKPVLLEPVMRVEVVVPDEYMGPVNGDLISRRGRLEGTEILGHHADHQGDGAAVGDVRLCHRAALAHAGPRQLSPCISGSTRKFPRTSAEEIISEGSGQGQQISNSESEGDAPWRKKNLIAASRT